MTNFVLSNRPHFCLLYCKVLAKKQNIVLFSKLWSLPVYTTFTQIMFMSCYISKEFHTKFTGTKVKYILYTVKEQSALKDRAVDGTCGCVSMSPPSEGTDEEMGRGNEGEGILQVDCSCCICSTCSFSSSIRSPHWKISPSSSLIQT